MKESREPPSGEDPTERAPGRGPQPITQAFRGSGSAAPSAATTEEDDADLPAGTMLGKYQIVRRLGRGGMGSVYEGIHTGISKPVALKTLSPRLASEPRAQARFLREAEASSRLEHPHVVDVIDFGSDGGITFLVMELLRGEDLGALLVRERGLPLERIADIMLAVCAGVYAAHEADVVHRDLKPPNIFLASTPLGDVVPKVLDFGISKMLDEEMSQTLTGTGTVIGTTPYLSPEQIAGHSIDARSDQYTLGVILYECATGRRPFEGDVMFTIMKNITEGRFRPLREARPDLPAAFEAVVLRAMSVAPDRRFETVHMLGRALMPFASAKARVLWDAYFGGGAAHDPTAPAPAPATEFLARPPEPALPRTRTRGQPEDAPPAAPPQEPAEVVRPRSPRAPALVAALVVLVGAGLLGWRALRSAPSRPAAVSVPAAAPPAPRPEPSPAPSAPAVAGPEASPAPPPATAPAAAPVKPPSRAVRRRRPANVDQRPGAAPILD